MGMGHPLYVHRICPIYIGHMSHMCMRYHSSHVVPEEWYRMRYHRLAVPDVVPPVVPEERYHMRYHRLAVPDERYHIWYRKSGTACGTTGLCLQAITSYGRVGLAGP